MLPNDILVLKALRQDARVKHTELAKKLGWPVSTTHERVKRCIKKYVRRNVALLNTREIGYGIRTLWIVRPHAGKRNAWLGRITQLPQLNTLSRLHSGDFFVETINGSRNDEYYTGMLLGRDARVAASYPLLEEITQEQFMTSAEGFSENDLGAGNLTAN